MHFILDVYIYINYKLRTLTANEAKMTYLSRETHKKLNALLDKRRRLNELHDRSDITQLSTEMQTRILHERKALVDIISNDINLILREV